MRSVGARESGRAAGLGEEEWETARRGAVYKEAGRGRVVRSTSRRGAEGARGGRGGRSGAAGPPGARPFGPGSNRVHRADGTGGGERGRGGSAEGKCTRLLDLPGRAGLGKEGRTKPWRGG
ncbi:hypothetical protein GQ55_8G046500 [Panicum hallii var. hallii]|uniref:Uncharacterized protein n=1 Tax=Panicum hallii var. hallii TaxID=1504633 RepID=A0A2T7CKS4_9POAL|nr:hypothetical protein GQ55_8G046500 [Panicum hallii var. hallii]